MDQEFPAHIEALRKWTKKLDSMSPEERELAKTKTPIYIYRLEEGIEFQRFVTDVLAAVLGIKLKCYEDKKMQLFGENDIGYEIKKDNLHRQYGNFFIETEEKSHPDNPEWKLSGIYRTDNSILYLIGDFDLICILLKNHLRKEQENNPQKYPIITTKERTARGFKLPKTRAEEMCDRIIYNPLAQLPEERRLYWEKVIAERKIKADEFFKK